MIDIAIVALPADRERAAAILDGLHEAQIAGINRTRFITVHPDDAAWIDVVQTVEHCPCAIFCWSCATIGPEAEPMRALGSRTLAANHAISVLLDVGALPLEMAASTTYPLYGWRLALGAWGRFFFGNSYLKQVAAAAARKVSGQDPPPPQLLWSMIRAQVWALLLGSFAILGIFNAIWGFYHDSNVAKLADRRGSHDFIAAKATRSCAALHQFIASHQDSPWTVDAQMLLASCHVVQQAHAVLEEKSFPAFGTTPIEAERDVHRLCEGYAATINGRLRKAELTDFIAGKSAMARCLVDSYENRPVEIIG